MKRIVEKTIINIKTFKNKKYDNLLNSAKVIRYKYFVILNNCVLA